MNNPGAAVSCSLGLPLPHSPNRHGSHLFTTTDNNSNLVFCHSFHLNGHEEISQL